MVRGRRCAFAATVDCNVRNSDDMSEPLNLSLYVPEACPTRSGRDHHTFAAEQVSAQIAVVRRSNLEYRKVSTAGRTSLLLSDSRFRSPINRRPVGSSSRQSKKENEIRATTVDDSRDKLRR